APSRAPVPDGRSGPLLLLGRFMTPRSRFPCTGSPTRAEGPGGTRAAGGPTPVGGQPERRCSKPSRTSDRRRVEDDLVELQLGVGERATRQLPDGLRTHRERPP